MAENMTRDEMLEILDGIRISLIDPVEESDSERCRELVERLIRAVKEAGE
jgi:hypothetical protein